jgi:uncharacterized protein YdhG (YjbR/CyaY superfamily)
MPRSAAPDAGGAEQKVRAYLAALSPDARRELKKVRELVRAAVPDAVEHFSYGIPGFKLEGRPLVWYAAFKEHFSLFPMTESIRTAHAKQLDGYETSKGTIRFPWSDPPSPTLVRRLVKARAAEARREAAARSSPAKTRAGRARAR